MQFQHDFNSLELELAGCQKVVTAADVLTYACTVNCFYHQLVAWPAVHTCYQVAKQALTKHTMSRVLSYVTDKVTPKIAATKKLRNQRSQNKLKERLTKSLSVRSGAMKARAISPVRTHPAVPSNTLSPATNDSKTLPKPYPASSAATPQQSDSRLPAAAQRAGTE